MEDGKEVRVPLEEAAHGISGPRQDPAAPDRKVLEPELAPTEGKARLVCEALLGSAESGDVLAEVVSRVEEEHHEIRGVALALVGEVEQLLGIPPRAHPGVQDLDGLPGRRRQATLEIGSEVIVEIDGESLGEGIAEEKHPVPALRLLVGTGHVGAQPVIVDLHERAPVDLPLHAALAPAGHPGPVEPAELGVRLPDVRGIGHAGQQAKSARDLDQGDAEDDAQEEGKEGEEELALHVFAGSSLRGLEKPGRGW
jgi:hypothetical protein